jgi:hypothetical protein
MHVAVSEKIGYFLERHPFFEKAGRTSVAQRVGAHMIELDPELLHAPRHGPPRRGVVERPPRPAFSQKEVPVVDARSGMAEI